MAWFHDTTYLGEDITLFLPDPDWMEGVKMEHRVERHIEEGLSRRENRRPVHEAMRVKQTWTLDVSRETAQDLLVALVNLGTRRVGVPVWPDRLEPADSAQRVYHAEYFIDYDESGFAINHQGSLSGSPAHKWRAPLLVGRLERRPEMEPWGEEDVRVSLTVVEDSPWDFRLSTFFVNPAPEWPSSLVANWVRLPKDTFDDVLEYRAVGDGRVQAVDGEEGVGRRTQSLRFTLDGRTAILNLVIFWAGHARGERFTMPLAFRPHTDTASSPWESEFRFDGDALTVEWHGQDHATTDVRVVQLPWEVSEVAGETPEQAAVTWLFRFAVNVPGGPLYWRLTSYEEPLDRDESGTVTYAPGFISFDRITTTADLSDDPVELAGWMVAGHPLLALFQEELEAPLTVEILRCDPIDPDAAVVAYSGTVRRVSSAGRGLTAPTRVLGGVLETKVPRFKVQGRCNHRLCGPGCGRDWGNWTLLGDIAAIDDNVITVTITNNPPGATLVADWLAGGTCFKGTGSTYEWRPIVRSAIDGSDQEITLQRPFRSASIGLQVSLRPHCYGSWDECETKFADGDKWLNYGGHRHIQDKNLSVPTRVVNSGGGKK